MLRWRLAGAIGLILPLLLLIWLDDQRNFGRPGIWLAASVVVFAAIACGELITLLHSGGPPVSRASGLVAAPLAMACVCVPIFVPVVRQRSAALGSWGWTALGLMLALVVIMLMEMQRFREPGRAVARAGVTLLAVVSILLPLSFLLHLRLISPDRIGLLALVSLIFVVKSADTGAFTAGRLFGKHAMSPKLSPKKTIEGAAGGVLAAVLAAWIFLRVFMPWAAGTAFREPNGLAVLLYGVSLAVAGMFGDLSVSLIKRDVDRKDSSSWLPGLGGLLDVMDSLLWTAPVAYLWWAWA